MIFSTKKKFKSIKDVHDYMLFAEKINFCPVCGLQYETVYPELRDSHLRTGNFPKPYKKRACSCDASALYKLIEITPDLPWSEIEKINRIVHSYEEYEAQRELERKAQLEAEKREQARLAAEREVARQVEREKQARLEAIEQEKKRKLIQEYETKKKLNPIGLTLQFVVVGLFFFIYFGTDFITNMINTENSWGLVFSVWMFPISLVIISSAFKMNDGYCPIFNYIEYPIVANILSFLMATVFVVVEIVREWTGDEGIFGLLIGAFFSILFIASPSFLGFWLINKLNDPPKKYYSSED